MKKFLKVFLLCTIMLPFVGCFSVKQMPSKTEYYLNEEATMDNIYKISLNDILSQDHFQDVEPENDHYLVLEFKITNISSETQTIDVQKSFQLKIDNTLYPDLNHNKDTEIAPQESIMYQLIYDVNEMDHYEILFYSGIVDNNIKFITK